VTDPDTLETINRLIEEVQACREEIHDLRGDSGLIEHLQSLCKRCHAIAAHHGFWPPEGRNKGEQLALVHSEVSEMLEGVRTASMDSHLPQYTSEEVECADTLIRLFDYIGGHRLRTVRALLAKIEYNEGRESKHGKLF